MNRLPNTINSSPELNSHDPRKSTYSITVSDFIVDFIGSLVPGLIFLILVISLAFTSIGYVVFVVNHFINDNDRIKIDAVISGTKDIGTDFGITISLMILIASYVIGHFFSRKDQRDPDEASYNKLITLKNKLKENHDWVTNNGYSDYPYNDLHSYLKNKGFEHLANLIKWKTSRENDNNNLQIKRSRFYINMMKIRLQFYFPEKNNLIRKNEGHVRLMSAVWHMSNTLNKFIIWAFVLCIASALLHIIVEFLSNHVNIFSNLWFIILPLILIGFVKLISFWSKNSVEMFLHFQRVREIMYVLETWHFAMTLYPEIANGLEYQFKKDECYCGGMGI